MQAPPNADFLPVTQVLDAGVDVAVKEQIASRQIGLVIADGYINLIAAQREAILIEPIPVGQADIALELEGRPPDNI